MQLDCLETKKESLCTEGVLQKHPLQLYLEYVGHLYRKMSPISEQERFEVSLLKFR